MSDQIILVTSPDEVQLDGPRVLLVDLFEEQNQIVSNALMKLDGLKFPMIVYSWKSIDPIDWLLDKRIKSDLIIFNADNVSDPYIIGYMAAMPRSYYLGSLKDLHRVNKNAIYSDEDCLILMEKISKEYYETRKTN